MLVDCMWCIASENIYSIDEYCHLLQLCIDVVLANLFKICENIGVCVCAHVCARARAQGWVCMHACECM